MIQYVYNSQSWGLDKPNLILSVTGGAQKFNIPQRMKKAFKRGLIKAAVSTGAWIITGGTNTGVMRLVGEAVAEEFQKGQFDLTVLGIATWGKIALREQMTIDVTLRQNQLIHCA
jgi:transient receptor potential cation channel subfamily M protein 2